MTREEAAEYFAYCLTEMKMDTPAIREAYELAIEVLQERPKGRWTICGGDMHRNGRFWHCTACGKDHFVPNRNAVNGAVSSRHYELPPYCPNCGADMRGEEG